jgi:serine/threonine-protein kinase
MKVRNALLISLLVIGAMATGYGLHDRARGLMRKVGHVAAHSLYHVVNVMAAKRPDHVAVPAPYFPVGAIWTQDISHAPVDPQSSATIAWLADAGGWGHNNRMQVDFGIRVLQADATTPNVRFQGPASSSADSDHPSSFPLPAGGGIEGETSYQCNIQKSDCHLIVADRGHGRLYEAYQANLSDNVLNANFVAVWDLNRVYPPSGRGDQCTSADAAGFPIAPLLFNADELASGSINHAIRFALPNPRIRAHVFVHPATHAGAPRGPVSAPPMGVRFRLKASYDLSKLTPAAQVVARAMQKYGMFLADGGNIALTAQNDADTKSKYADMDFDSHDLADLKVTDFEVVDLGTPIRLTDDCVRNR